MAVRQHFSSLNSSADNMYELTDEDIVRLHQTLLEMYKDINVVAKKHKIHLIAAGGTALGAIRHKGFIPWDDDLDIFILRKEYKKLKKVFDRELGNKYCLLDPRSKEGANCFLPRIMKKGTTFLNMLDETSPHPHGIYIDINIMDYAPENKLHFALKALTADALRVISYSVYWYKYKSESFEKFMLESEGARYYKLRMLMGKIFSFRSPEKWFRTFDLFVEGKKTNKITVPSGTKKYVGECLDKDIVIPLKKVRFEDTEIYVVGKHHEYLTNLYGDYMEIPKKAGREHHLCLKLSFDEEL